MWKLKNPANGYCLIDSAERARTNPETWAHTPAQYFRKILPGFYVKVGVEHPAKPGERFWGEVKEKTTDGFVIQVKQADMLYAKLHGIADNAKIVVHERNIFGIVMDDGTPVWEALHQGTKS